MLYMMTQFLEFLWYYQTPTGWSGGAMVLGKLPVPGRPTILITVGQGPFALALCAGGGSLDIFTLINPFSPLWETARYRLKYCLKGPLNPKQPTNQSKSTLPRVLRIPQLNTHTKSPVRNFLFGDGFSIT